ncbi:protein KRI1 homolog [Cyclospora cayetanensis]|uniref:Protein KRI1 homolog n=1 Tax=Cyclospora cayetanensis TaxID=88456 RepID=A0A6P6S1C6_9EIME|nr:protein KRI1 homolog [Cyclospora cayetanensis]
MPRKVKRGPKGPRGCSDSPGAPSVQAMEVKDLLCDSDKEDAEAGGEQHRAEGQLKINKAFAEKYDQRKRTELLSKHKEALQELSGSSYEEDLASLRKSFLQAAEEATEGNREAGEGEELLELKCKGMKEQEQEDTDYRQFLNAKHAQRGVASDSVLARFWADDGNLNANERFLRDYIVNEAWREDKAQAQWQGMTEVDDEEDDEQLEKAEAFEASYNFRFEEEGGTNIQGHPRVISDSVRQKDDKRKRAREKKQKQKEEEQLRRREELKRLKSLKREEIAEKIRQIQQVGGLDEATVSRVLDLGGAFDSEAHDVEMQKLFGEDYDAQDEEGDCLAMPEACADILSTAHETEPEALTKKQRKLLKLESKRKRQGQRVEGYAKDAEAQVVETEDAGASEQGEPHSKGGDQDSAGQRAEEGTEAEWWMCDGCGIGIRGGKKRFDCTTCENFTLCKPCFRNVRHPHQLVRKTVPPHCNPPKDFVSGALHCPPPAELSELLDEYFQLDYEDIIGGDLPTRFKYRKVQPNNYGMTTEEILNSTDAELNSKVSLKKLAPYREQEHSGNTAEKPWRQQWRSKARESQPTDSKLKKRERTDRAMTPFGVRKDRLAAYDA